MRLIDAAMERDDTGCAAGSIDVVALEDVTPRYATASATLNVCRACLGCALQQLSEFSNSA